MTDPDARRGVTDEATQSPALSPDISPAIWPTPELTEILDVLGAPRQERFTPAAAAHALGGGLVRTDGRAARSEYWWGSLLLVAIWAPITAALLVLLQSESFIVVGAAAVGLCVWLPFVAFVEALRAVRRLHDADHRGWWVGLAFVPLGLVALAWLLTRPGTRGANRFGAMSQPGWDRSEALLA